jgi:acetyl esterase/lipase
VVVFFYGGRWEVGDKSDYAFAGSSFAQQDFITVVPNYSKYPQVKFPVFVEDGAKAVAWTYDHIGEYNGRSGAIHVAGHSSGAHIGALITADKKYLAAEGKNIHVIKSFAGLAGPYDFTPDAPDLISIFGPPSQYPQMQVTTFIDGHEPPMLLLWGDADKDVYRSNLDKLVQRIQQKHGQVKTIIYPGVDHVQIVAALSWLNPSGAPVLADITHFFRQ